MWRNYNDCNGPLSVLMGTSALIGCTTKHNYIIKFLRLSPSYEDLEMIRCSLCCEVSIDEKGILSNLSIQDRSLFEVNNFYQYNVHGITMTGKNNLRIQVTAIQDVPCNVNSVIP